MNYTEKYHLPQWEETDRVMRTDFNQMCVDMERGLDGNNTKIEQVREEAAAAKKTALTYRSYVVGNYVGNGGTQSINVGFRPSFVIVSGQTASSYSTSIDLAGYFSITGGTNQPGRISFTDTGFTVYPATGNREDANYPMMNSLNHNYNYIAFM